MKHVLPTRLDARIGKERLAHDWETDHPAWDRREHRQQAKNILTNVIVPPVPRLL